MTKLGPTKQLLSKTHQVYHLFLFLPHLTPELNGHNVAPLGMLEINLTADHVGLMEPPKLTMIDYVLKLTELSILLYLPLIPQHVVDSSVVSHRDVTEDKLELLGLGLKVLVSSLEEISMIKLLVILTPCNNVDITLTRLLILIVLLLLKTLQHVDLLVLEIKLLIIQIKKNQLLAMD